MSASSLEILTSLLNAESLELISDVLPKTPMLITPLGELFLPLEGLIDVEQERARLEKEIAKARTDLEREEKNWATRRCWPTRRRKRWPSGDSSQPRPENP
ncbi:MAG: hypothetical protein HC904_12145 [Blastochloris sp.]|nr:hypothetical protein [Blastochloris sp.]